MKRESGITLVALIITIIVMIILAGIAISVAVGDGGVIKKAQTAADSQKYKTAREQIEAQSVYITEGENVGKIDLETTFENINNLGLEEINYVEKAEDGSAIKVTLKNGEVIIIEGESNSSLKYYKIPKEYMEGYLSEAVDILLAIDYENEIVDLYFQNQEGKWQMSGTGNLQNLSSDLNNKIIKVNGNNVALDASKMKMYNDGSDYMFVLPSKIYIPDFNSEEEDVFLEILPTSENINSSELINVKGNLLELINNRTISVGTIITGYEANGYRGSWIVYNIVGENVQIVPSSSNWNETYTYNTQITNKENLTNVENIYNKYLDADFASSVSLPISIEDAFATYYINGSGINNFGAIYMEKDGELRAANASSKSGSRKERRTTRFW